jgi:hypothetical protein
MTVSLGAYITLLLAFIWCAISFFRLYKKYENLLEINTQLIDFIDSIKEIIDEKKQERQQDCDD